MRSFRFAVMEVMMRLFVECTSKLKLCIIYLDLALCPGNEVMAPQPLGLS